MEVGNRIRGGREGLGLSQEDLAREIFVSRQTVSNWETSKTYPDVQSLLLLSNLFGVTVDSLVKGDVEVMQQKIDEFELDRFKMKAGMGLAYALIALGGMTLGIMTGQGQTFLSPFLIVAALLFVLGMALAFYAARIQTRYDIKTMREVKAFLDGTDPDQIERTRTIPSAARVVLQCLIGALGGIIFMTIVIHATTFASVG